MAKNENGRGIVLQRGKLKSWCGAVNAEGERFRAGTLHLIILCSSNSHSLSFTDETHLPLRVIILLASLVARLYAIVDSFHFLSCDAVRTFLVAHKELAAIAGTRITMLTFDLLSISP